MIPERCSRRSLARVARAALLFAAIAGGGLWLMARLGPAADAEAWRVEVRDARGRVEECQVVAGRVTIAGDGYAYQDNGRSVFHRCPGRTITVTRVRPSPEACP